MTAIFRPRSPPSLTSATTADSPEGPKTLTTPETPTRLHHYQIYTREFGAIDGPVLLECIERILAQHGVKYDKQQGVPWDTVKNPTLYYADCDCEWGPASFHICLPKIEMDVVLLKIRDDARAWYDIVLRSDDGPMYDISS
ncbi:hypothetical protein MBLNU457_4046t3 [Dothideomycetes sp. NU457]